MKIIQITDPHLVAPGGRLYDLDPAARLARCIESIAAEHGDAALCVVTGDLADRGTPEAYALLREILRPLPMPVRLLLGNHDDRSAFRAVFPEVQVDPAGFVQSVLDVPAARLLFLDTLERGAHGAGVLCPARLGWIAARLAEVPGRPVYVFMHHPPRSIGVRHFRRMLLAAPDDFLDLVHRHGSVRHLFFGHVHLPVSGRWGPFSFSAMRGTCQHIDLELDDPDVAFAEGSPSYGVILLEGEDVIVHLRDFLAPEPRFDAMTGRRLKAPAVSNLARAILS
ncbi:Icc protein [Inquilinus ginsengisoli]|uniref:phosphodiesterase n=1 Tax=Inquilinus ginsengisoli TaxID=363840 RepID=UPI003D1CCC3B